MLFFSLLIVNDGEIVNKEFDIETRWFNIIDIDSKLDILPYHKDIINKACNNDLIHYFDINTESGEFLQYEM